MGYYTPNVSLLTKRDQVYGEEKDNADENTLKNGGVQELVSVKRRVSTVHSMHVFEDGSLRLSSNLEDSCQVLFFEDPCSFCEFTA